MSANFHLMAGADCWRDTPRQPQHAAGRCQRERKCEGWKAAGERPGNWETLLVGVGKGLVQQPAFN